MPPKKQCPARQQARAAARTGLAATKAVAAGKSALAKNEADLRRSSLTEAPTDPPPLAEVYQVKNTCTCARCLAMPKGKGVTITGPILAQSALRLKAMMIAELEAHGLTLPKGVDVKVLHAQASAHLVKKGAFLLTEPVESTKGTKKAKKVRGCARGWWFINCTQYNQPFPSLS